MGVACKVAKVLSSHSASRQTTPFLLDILASKQRPRPSHNSWREDGFQVQTDIGYVSVSACVCVHVHVHVHVHACLFVRVCLCLFTFVFVCVCMYVCVCVHLYVCEHVYVYVFAHVPISYMLMHTPMCVCLCL